MSQGVARLVLSRQDLASRQVPIGSIQVLKRRATSCVWTASSIPVTVPRSTSCDLVHDSAIRPKFAEELQVVKLTTANVKVELNKILNAQEIVFFQDLIRKIPVADNVIEYAVKLVNKTRLNSEYTAEVTKKYLL